MAVRNSNPAAQVDIDSSTKRIAWAYGCAKKGSPEEAKLRALLNLKVINELNEAMAQSEAQLKSEVDETG